ncbi:receptor-like serine/threonine-protein kinase SD1-8 [Lactuca sativa]|uniref:receptor-like serine/threonine-protein kinase SD1-8 n=1 Tax=Lactuca sativa TaxID=4236 RepID=UPI0022AEA5C9|nr:receptor-like serine/threonine-protein kinase SD1-8 [Lactuca sativa]
MFIFSLFFFYPFLSVAVDTITPTQPLTINQTLVSNGDVFELGFFNANNGSLYIGIWYKQIQQLTYVWVANRDTPITSSSGNLTIVDNGNMVLVDQVGTVVWSSNQPKKVVKTVAQLLDNGNFVLRPENDEKPENYIWQSFDYPTDTLLPEMKLGWDRKSGITRRLQSWKTSNDPATGDYSFKLDTSGFPELLTLKNETRIWRTGPWNGIRFSGVPQMVGVDIMQFELQDNSDEISYKFEMVNNSIYSRLVINSSGINQRLVWAKTTETWRVYWSFPGDCDHYGECGPFGVCDTTTAPFCNCLTGFQPKNKQLWDLRDRSDGCVRSSVLDCGSDGFLQLKNMKLPESWKAIVDEMKNLSECGEMCRKNCSCGAYANMNINGGGSGCVMWGVDLMDMRRYAGSQDGGQDIYVRAAASDLAPPPVAENTKSGSANSNHVGKVVGITMSACVVLIFILMLVYFKRKKTPTLITSMDREGPQGRTEDSLVNDEVILPNRRRDNRGKTTMDELELPLFDFTTLAIATNNFSKTNELGRGGFGPVYKGILKEGEVVAVKRLAKICDQGIEELKNEVQLIAKLQHRNLVRVLGCCIEVEEKLLIYEFMENKSLDMYLFFGKEESMKLNWKIRFEIIRGIARGLHYLHHDSIPTIVHRDMKASNILLDKEMKPKISDFGIARIFGRDQKEAQTKIVIGTYGYMSPEYMMNGSFSRKSDVFSFGVLILEIVSGKRNRGSSNTDSQLNLLAQAWNLWNERRALELLDESIGTKFSINEVLRCIQIGLLCVQELPKDRPKMSEVMLLLSSETVGMSPPKHPGFFFRNENLEPETSSKKDDSMTVNQITLTVIEPR